MIFSRKLFASTNPSKEVITMVAPISGPTQGILGSIPLPTLTPPGGGVQVAGSAPISAEPPVQPPNLGQNIDVLG